MISLQDAAVVNQNIHRKLISLFVHVLLRKAIDSPQTFWHYPYVHTSSLNYCKLASAGSVLWYFYFKQVAFEMSGCLYCQLNKWKKGGGTKTVYPTIYYKISLLGYFKFFCQISSCLLANFSILSFYTCSNKHDLKNHSFKPSEDTNSYTTSDFWHHFFWHSSVLNNVNWKPFLCFDWKQFKQFKLLGGG